MPTLTTLPRQEYLFNNVGDRQLSVNEQKSAPSKEYITVPLERVLLGSDLNAVHPTGI
jgi:hypothetical protein